MAYCFHPHWYKTRKLRTILLEGQTSVLGNTSMSGQSLADCMDKINNICTCNKDFYSNQRLFCYRMAEKCFKKERGKKKRSIFTERKDLKRGYQCQKTGTERLAFTVIIPK